MAVSTYLTYPEPRRQHSLNVKAKGTQQCKDYTIVISGKTCLIIDTPGLDDSPEFNLSVLNKIAAKLRASPRVTGVIYFHRATNTRLTGSARSNIDLFLKICGQSFYGQSAFVTTMWNTISPQERPRFERLNRQVYEKMAAWTLNRIDKCEFDKNKPHAAIKVLDNFAKKQGSARLLLDDQLDHYKVITPDAVRKTSAGRKIVKDMSGQACVIL